ncbi:MAG: flavodoxin family protein [Endomicrobiales bacterium]
MKNLVVYYSYSGDTEAAALSLAAEIQADTVKVEDVKRPSILKAFLSGALAAHKGRAWPIKPVIADLAAYDRVFIGAPVWWSLCAPEINAFIDQASLSGKQVVVFVTMAGSNPAAALKALAARVEAKGGKTVSSFSIKTGGKKKDAVAALARGIAAPYK